MAEAIGTAIVTAVEAIFYSGEWVFTASQISAIGSAATALAVTGYSANQRRKAAARARAAYNASLRDRHLTVRGTLEERDLVMGRVRKGGYFYPVGTVGADSEKLVFLVVMAGHSCNAVVTNYFDEHALTLDGSGYVTSAPFVSVRKVSANESMTLSGGAGTKTLANTPITGTVRVIYDAGGGNGTDENTPSVTGSDVTVSGFGSYSGSARVHYQYEQTTKHARIRWMMGADSQAAFADLVTMFPSLWTSNHRLRGCTYAVIELDYATDVFPGGVPNFSALMEGADTVYDPRDLSTGYSENPALLMRWYALHAQGGRRTGAQIDEASIIAAANVCDANVDYGDGSTDIYKAGLVAKAGQAPADALDELAESMAGRWGYTQGKVRVRAGALGATVAAIDGDWMLTRQMEVRPRRTRTDLRNVLQGTFADSDNDYQTLQFTRVEDAPSVTADGTELVGEIELAAVFRNGQAQQVAATMLRYERQALAFTCTLKMRAYPLQLFDVVSWTLPDMGWSAKLFEVVDRSFTLGGGLQFTFKEIDSTIFAFGTTFPINDPAPNTELPSPTTVPTVGTLTVTSTAAALLDGSVVARTRVSWAALADRGVQDGGHIEVAYLDASQSVSEYQIVRADQLTEHTIVGLRVGRHYVFKARAVNGSRVRGNWSAAATHKVTGTRSLRTFLQTTAPTDGDLIAGELWFDSDDGNRQYRYSGSAWVATPDGTRNRVFVAGSAPTAESAGDLWIHTGEGNALYRWSGSAWTAYTLGTDGIADEAATEVVSVEDGSATASWTRPAVGINTVYRAALQEISWANATGASVLVECTADFTAARTSGAGSVYLVVHAGTSSTSSQAMTDDGGVVTGSTPNADGTERRLVRTFSRTVADGATLYLAAVVYITTAADTTTAMSAADIDLRLVAIKR